MKLEQFYNKKLKSIYTYETKLGADLVCDYLLFVFDNYSFRIEVSASGEGLSIITNEDILKEIQRTKIKYIKKSIKGSNDYISKIDFNISEFNEIDSLVFILDRDILKISLDVDSLHIEFDNK